MSGKVDYYKELLFQCLWEEHQYNKKKEEIKFPWGITLNISEPLHASGEFLRLNKRRLRRVFSFHEGQLRSQYSFFRDKQIKDLQPPHIIGIGGPVSTPKALARGYALSLFQFEEKIQFLFQKAGGRPLRAIAWENGANSPITAFGSIQGPITAFGYW
jgi:hypothetical protein